MYDVEFNIIFFVGGFYDGDEQFEDLSIFILLNIFAYIRTIWSAKI